MGGSLPAALDLAVARPVRQRTARCCSSTCWPRSSGSSRSIRTTAQSLLAEAAVDSSWALRRLAVLVSSMRSPYLLVLDHVETVEDERCGDLIAVVALNLPEGSRLALASQG